MVVLVHQIPNQTEFLVVVVVLLKQEVYHQLALAVTVLLLRFLAYQLHTLVVEVVVMTCHHHMDKVQVELVVAEMVV